MGKLELTIEFYKGKYEEYTKLNELVAKIGNNWLSSFFENGK